MLVALLWILLALLKMHGACLVNCRNDIMMHCVPDESQMGGLSSLLSSPPNTPTSPCVPKPPKKRYLEETFSVSGQPSHSTWDSAQNEASYLDIICVIIS